MLHSVPVSLSENTSFCLLNNCMQRITSLPRQSIVPFHAFAAFRIRHHHNTVLVGLFLIFVSRVTSEFINLYKFKTIGIPFLFAFCVAINALCFLLCKFSFNTCWMLAASICTYRSSERISLWPLSHAPACVRPLTMRLIRKFYTFISCDLCCLNRNGLNHVSENENKWDLTRLMQKAHQAVKMHQTTMIISRWFFNIIHSVA